MKPLVWALGVFAVGFGPVFGAEGWKLVWADEFDQPNGSAPNPTNWVCDLGGNGWGNNELEAYTDRRVNSRTEESNATLLEPGSKSWARLMQVAYFE